MVAFLVGLFIGAFIGVAIMCLVSVNRGEEIHVS